jgi:sortase B
MKKRRAIGRGIIRLLDEGVNLIVMTVLLAAMALGGYSIWDSQQVYREGDASVYTRYKPGKDELSFEELRKINPEVFGWLTVFGTHIDYPITQTDNNEKYVNTGADGEFSLAGSIFLDYQNSQAFTDFNSILYGHHMEKGAMFGDLENFQDEAFFEEHQYGNLYYGGKDHGIEFFAFLRTDAYDHELYEAAIENRNERQSYLKYLASKAVRIRDIGITEKDHIVLLSTCTSDSTNGRQLLAGRLTDKIYADN